MRRALAIAALLAISGAAWAQGPGGARGATRMSPDPSAIVAAEMAFNRLAQEKGQWAAFRETAAKDAIMFVPQRVVALDWLKGRKEPAKPVTWQPHSIFVSCNGMLAASAGAAQWPDGGVGYFTTVWRRDAKKGWQWIMDHGDRLNTPRAAPDMIAGRVAKCKRVARAVDAPLPAAAKPPKKGDAPPSPPDESLRWTADIATDGSRHVQVMLWTGTEYETVIDDRVAEQPS